MFLFSKFNRLGLCALFVVIGMAGCSKSESPPAGGLEKFTLQLHWIPDTHQIGFWTALDKGMYQRQGLDITIHPGGLDANPIKNVVSESADVGQVGGIEQVITAVSEALPIKAIASIHRETPHALISLAQNPIQKPADFAGKTIAVAFGDTAELLLKAYMRQAGIKEDAVKLVPFKFDLTPLMTGQVQAITGFSSGQPATLEKLGYKPVVLAYSTAGIASYGYTLITSTSALAKKGKAIDAFVKASREGWEYVFAHPDEAVSMFKKRFGAEVDEKLVQRELSLIKPLMTDKEGKLATWKLDDSRVTGDMSYLQQQGQIKKPIAASAVFENSHTE